MKKFIAVLWNSICGCFFIAGIVGIAMLVRDLFTIASGTTGFGAFGLILLGIVLSIADLVAFILFGYFFHYNTVGSADRVIDSIRDLYSDNNGKIIFKDGYAIIEDNEGYKSYITEAGAMCLTFGKPLVYKSESAICKECRNKDVCMKRGENKNVDLKS